MSSPQSKPEQELEQRIRDDRFASDALDKLLKVGCNRSQLWSCLGAIGATTILPPLYKWESRSQFTKKQAKALAKRLVEDAEALRGFFTPTYRWVLTQAIQERRWLDLLDKYLGMAATLIDAELLRVDDRTADDTRLPRQRLTQYVLHATRKPHDKEVADLIRVVLGWQSYTAEEQRKFRTRPTRTGLI